MQIRYSKSIDDNSKCNIPQAELIIETAEAWRHDRKFQTNDPNSKQQQQSIEVILHIVLFRQENQISSIFHQCDTI